MRKSGVLWEDGASPAVRATGEANGGFLPLPADMIFRSFVPPIIRRWGAVLQATVPRRTVAKYSVRTARICSIPLLVLAFTGWIPDRYAPQRSWSWSATTGFSLIAVAVIGLFRPVVETLRGEIEKSLSDE
jgi:hypothetical protein